MKIPSVVLFFLCLPLFSQAAQNEADGTVVVPPKTEAFTSNNWSQSITDSALKTYLDGSDLAILVVAAGTELTEAKQAAAELQNALKATGKTKLVMSVTTGLPEIQIHHYHRDPDLELL